MNTKLERYGLSYINMNELVIIFLIFVQVLLGFSIYFFISGQKRVEIFSDLPIAFCLGVGITSYLLFLLSIFGLLWNPVPIIILTILPIFILRKYIPPIEIDLINSFKKNRFLDKILLSLNIGVVLYTFFQVLLRPLYAWDGWAIWLLKSKVFFYDGFLNPGIYHLLRDSYPFIMNLNNTFYYLFLGKPDDKAVLIVYFIFYLMTGIAIFSALRNIVGLTLSLLASFLFLSSQNVIRHGGRFEAGYSDLALGFYIFISTLFFRKAADSSDNRYYLLLGLLLGILSLIKQEGVVASLLIGLMGIFMVLKHKDEVFKKFLALLIGYMPLALWINFKIQNNISYSLYEDFKIYLDRINEILLGIGREMISIQNWNFLWIFFLFCLPFMIISRRLKYEIIFIFALIFIYVFVFLGGPHDPTIHIANTMNRLLLHIAPLAVYCIFISIHEIIKGYKK